MKRRKVSVEKKENDIEKKTFAVSIEISRVKTF